MRNQTRQLVFSGLFIAMGVVLPMVFHLFGGAGPAFLPMHLPVLIAGLVLSPVYALGVGALTPILSSLLTGMPPLYPMLVIMVFELACYGFVMSLLVHKYRWNVYLALITSMIVGRVVAALVVAILIAGFNLQFMQPIPYFMSAISTGILGIVLQLLIVPACGYLLKKYMPEFEVA